MPCGTVSLRQTGQMSRPAVDKDYSTCIHSFLQDLCSTPLPFPTGPVLYRWLVGFYLSNLFSFIPLSLSSLFIFWTYSKWICWAGQIGTEMTLGLSVFCPPLSFIVSSLSPTPCWFSSKFPKRLIKFLQIIAPPTAYNHFYAVPATFIFLDSHAKTKINLQYEYTFTWHQQVINKTNITEVQDYFKYLSISKSPMFNLWNLLEFFLLAILNFSVQTLKNTCQF